MYNQLWQSTMGGGEVSPKKGNISSVNLKGDRDLQRDVKDALQRQ